MPSPLESGSTGQDVNQIYEMLDRLGWVFIGILLTQLFSIWRERRRDREAREHSAASARQQSIRIFKAFLIGWKSELPGYPYEWSDFEDSYKARFPKVAEAADLVRGLFTGDLESKFNSLVTAACGHECVRGEDPQDRVNKIAKTIDDLIRFVNAP